jgi:polyhydroxybutyrate depolymerase
VSHWKWANGCSAKSTATAPAPCVTYDGCKSPVVWCRIPGLGHEVWDGGAKATWEFFARF